LNLKAKDKTKWAPKGSKDLEAFLAAVENEIMDQIFDNKKSYKPNPKSEAIKVVSKNLKVMSMVAIPTDKMSSFKCIHIYDYKNRAMKHLLKNGKEISRDKLLLVFLQKWSNCWKVLNI
jgi:hypothetical protein